MASRALLKELHPDLHYIGSSADGPVSGHGPYQALPPETYFRTADIKLHSEIGSPNIPSYESLRLMMPESSQWPQALDWGLHDFCLKGAQGGESFRSIIDEGYGGAESAAEWVKLAQFVNYDTYRAMFESQGKYRMGLLLWMSHPCWPSFVWQTYDYYLAPTAAYFACKKACEPIHIQRNPVTEKVEVVNVSGGDQKNLNAKLQILDDRGTILATQSDLVDSREDSLEEAFAIRYPDALTDVHFLRLSLSRGDVVLSKNFYVRGRELGNYRGVRALPSAKVLASTESQREGDTWKLTTKLRNTSRSPALMLRISAVRAKTGGSYSSGDLQRQLHRADARRGRDTPYRVATCGYSRGETANRGRWLQRFVKPSACVAKHEPGNECSAEPAATPCFPGPQRRNDRLQG